MPNQDGQRQYGPPSSVGDQIRTDYYYKKALIEIRDAQFFMPLADARSMPKNYGKSMKQYHYLPLLDDRNINDQGLDAAGSAIAQFTASILITKAGVNVNTPFVAAGYGATDGAATTEAEAAALDYFAVNGVPLNVDYAGTKADAIAAGWLVDDISSANGNAKPYGGNLYGSSRDIGTVSGKLPALTEFGGRVNRVGFTRIVIEGSIEKFGFFDEYTQESLDFDSDEELEMHVVQESLEGANNITEDALQLDLLNGAGVVRYAGAAISNVTVDGNAPAAADNDIVTYNDLMRLSIDLDNNRCPKSTKMIVGSRMTDTRTINNARLMYVGPEMLPTLRGMKDLHDNPAFISVEQYAHAGSLNTKDTNLVVNGEAGAVDSLRIIVNPEMMRWEGAGAAVATNTLGYRETGGNFDVHPMLVVGSGSFTTIGFQTDGKTVKFKINHKKPGMATATHQDPYGEIGFYAIKWYYGILYLRPEWIAVVKTLATL